MIATRVPAIFGFGSVLILMLCGFPSSAATGYTIPHRNSSNSNKRVDSHRVLEDTASETSNYYDYSTKNYYDYSTKKSKKEKKKSYYTYYSTSYYSPKKGKSCKGSKGSKKSYYGYNCEEIETPTEPPVTETEVGDTDADQEEEVIEVEVSETNKSEKKSKKDKKKSNKKDKKDKSYKSKKSEKSDKKEKGSKSSKGIKKDKSIKQSKKTLSPKSSKSPSPSPPDDEGFTPSESWKISFNGAVDTGFLFYDSTTKYAWYAYNADFGVDEVLVSKSSASAVDGTVLESHTVIEGKDSVTMGRICPIDTTKKGEVIETMCIDIKPPKEWQTATSTTIQSAEACYASVTGAVFKLAVVVKDTSKFMQFYDELVGGRLIVYDISLAGKAQDPIIAEVAYEGWESLYGDPTINGRPSFSPDCRTVYSTWLTSGTVITETEGSTVIINLEPTATTTVAINVDSVANNETTPELWRLGTNSRLAGLTASKDGKTLYSAINVAEGDSLRSGGMVALEAATGKIVQQYAFPNTGGVPHSAYTNVVLDNSGHTYHVDSLYGLVKFEGDDLNDGPIWSVIGSDTEMTDQIIEENTMKTRHLNPLRPRDKEEKNIVTGGEERTQTVETKSSVVADEIFTAFKPALDASKYSTVYSCGGSAVDNEVDSLIALDTVEGESVWFTALGSSGVSKAETKSVSGDETDVVDVGSCSGITDDVRWAPSSAAGPESEGIYISRGNKVQCLDGKNGTILWTYDAMGDHDISKFAVVSGEAVLVANGGSVVLLETREPTPSPTIAPSPLLSTPVETPVVKPTRKPTSPTPSPVTVKPIGNPASPPSSSPPPSSAVRTSYSIGFLSGLPLLLFLWQ